VTFEQEVDTFCDGAIGKIERIRRYFIGKLCIMIIDKTPVLSGYLKGQWEPSKGAPRYEQIPRKSKEGASVKQELLSVLASLKGDETFYFSNNAPYVLVIEGLEVHSSGKVPASDKAPNGMVRVSIAAASRLTNEAIREAQLQ
jgi:hypothetical protein